MTRALWVVLVVAVMGCAGSRMGGGPLYQGGDGTSVESAVVVHASGEQAGIKAEYDWIYKHYPGCKVGGQALLMEKGRAYDRIDIVEGGGAQRAVYFEISSFYGKM